MKELLKELESCNMCLGLPDTDEVKDVVVDPTTTQEYMPGAIIRHSVPKSVDCYTIKEATRHLKNSCQPA